MSASVAELAFDLTGPVGRLTGLAGTATVFAGIRGVVARHLVLNLGKLIEPILAAGQARALIGQPLPLVSLQLTPIGQPLTLIGQPLTLVSLQLTPIGQPLTLIGQPLTLIGIPLAVIGLPLALIGVPLTPVRGGDTCHR